MTGDPRSGRSAWHRLGWKRYLYPVVWLAYLLQTGNTIGKYQHGALEATGYAILVVFSVVYVVAVSWQWGAVGAWGRWLLWVLVALWLAAIPLAHEDAYIMCVYITVLAVARWVSHAVPIVAGMTALSTFGPALVPSWHAGIRWDALILIPLVAFAMWAFFGILRSNKELTAARAEVARLAAENERTRIARDLHDLLGHSLTAITVKAGLARRLSERGQADQARAEIGEVERLSRRTLADVRAAVSGQREIRLANELASAREALRAAGVETELPGSVDIVDPSLSELFGWVVREGVTNVVRHARATRCVITLGPDWIDITDDGRAAVSGSDAGTGLAGLRERVTAAGGTLNASGGTGGWRLRVDVPAPAESPRPGPVPARTIDK